MQTFLCPIWTSAALGRGVEAKEKGPVHTDVEFLDYIDSAIPR